MLELPTAALDSESSSSSAWKLQLSIQAKLHEVLRQGEKEELRIQRESASNSASASTNISPVKAAASSSGNSATSAASPLTFVPTLDILSPAHTVNILAQGIIIPAYKPPTRRRKETGYEVDRPSVFTVHARALIDFVTRPAAHSTAVASSSPTLPSPASLLTSPHVASAFSRQLCEIHDRFLYSVSQHQRAEERSRQGEWFEEYELWTEEEEERGKDRQQQQHHSSEEEAKQHDDCMDTSGSLDDSRTSFASTSHPVKPAVRHPQPYLYTAPIDSFVVPIFPLAHLTSFVRLLASARSQNDATLLTLGIRALNILALRDENRLGMVSSGAVKLVLEVMRFDAGASLPVTTESARLIANCAFALVVFCRPLGSSEGATFFHPLNLTNQAVSMIMHPPESDGLGGADLLASHFARYSSFPNTVAKLAWAMVNLSNEEGCKMRMVQSRIMQEVGRAIQRWPTSSKHRDLHLRLVLAHVNLVSHHRIRAIVMHENHILHVLLKLMQAFPYFWTLQRHCAVILRALASAQYGHTIRSDFPGLIEACLRFYLHCLPSSLHPNPDCREIVLQVFELLPSIGAGPGGEDGVVGVGGFPYSPASISHELEHVNDLRRRRGEQEMEMVFGRESAEEDGVEMDTSGSSNQQAACASTSAPPPAAPLSPRSLLLHDRDAVELQMSQRRTDALVQWHRAAMREERLRGGENSVLHGADDATLREQHPLSVAVFGRPLSRIEFHMQMQVLHSVRQTMRVREEEEEELDAGVEMEIARGDVDMAASEEEGSVVAISDDEADGEVPLDESATTDEANTSSEAPESLLSSLQTAASSFFRRG
jgi:hypothetical protein